MNGLNLAYKTKRDVVYSRSLALILDFFVISISLFMAMTIGNIKANFNIILPVLLCTIAYFTFMETVLGASVGKLIIGLRVMDKSCNKPKLYQSLIRSLLWFFEANPVLFIPPIISYLLVSQSKFKQRIGDRIAGTFVVYRRDLKEFLKNTYENSMNLNDYMAYHDLPKVKMVQGNEGNYIFDPKNVFIEFSNKKLRVQGIENLTPDQVLSEVSTGGRFVLYYQCVSAIIISEKKASNIYFIKSDQKPTKYMLRHTIKTFLFGWWQFPSGIIWTISCLVTNLKGGVDMTYEVVKTLRTGIQIEGKIAETST